MRRGLAIFGGLLLAAATYTVQGFGEADTPKRPPAKAADERAADERARPGAGEPEADPGFIMHEWGTFTTFSGSDGVHLEYRPLDTDYQDLPNFVFDRVRQSGMPFFTKSRIRAKVRMETPVTYFYTDRQRVRVSVDFPDGLLTEFYPPVRSMAPAFDRKAAVGEGEPLGNSSLDWGEVDLIPLSAFRPDVSDPKLADFLQQRTLQTILPTGNSYTQHAHYAHARETDSALVHVSLPQGNNRGASGSFIEKFLFYRGVGKFQLPVHVRFDDQQRPIVDNRGKRPLSSMILLDIDGEEMRMAVLPALAAEATAVLPEPKVVSNQQVAARVVQALVEEGLYEKEARSMVRTWQDSWIGEVGTRLLYMVPEQDTERVLPLHIDPPPAESVRVLVGRMEIMPPAREQQLVTLVSDHLDARRRHAKVCEQLVKQHGKDVERPAAAPLPKALIEMDRFAEPALARVVAISRDADIRQEAKTLINELKQR